MLRVSKHLIPEIYEKLLEINVPLNEKYLLKRDLILELSVLKGSNGFVLFLE